MSLDISHLVFCEMLANIPFNSSRVPPGCAFAACDEKNPATKAAKRRMVNFIGAQCLNSADPTRTAGSARLQRKVGRHRGRGQHEMPPKEIDQAACRKRGAAPRRLARSSKASRWKPIHQATHALAANKPGEKSETRTARSMQRIKGPSAFVRTK